MSRSNQIISDNKDNMNGNFRIEQSLQSKLIILTIIFVMVAEVLAFVPSVANMRVRWLNDRLNTAAAAALVADDQGRELGKSAQDNTLMATGTKSIVLRYPTLSRVIASAEMPPQVTHHYDMDHVTAWGAIVDAFDTLLFGGDRVIRVFQTAGDNVNVQIELVMEDKQLRFDMWIYARNVLFISIIIAVITAGLLFFAINRLMLSPIQRMIGAMQKFSDNPEDASRIAKTHDVPGRRHDELWLAEQHLIEMQTQLNGTLRQQKRLADLGLAVSKINHDMRNILTSAQLISDRMQDVDDPMVKRFGPKLVRTIDRAVSYSSEVMAYGKASEAAPKLRRLCLHKMVSEIVDILSTDAHNKNTSHIEFVIDIDETLEVDADSEQLFRVIFNLTRNAFQALESDMQADDTIIQRIHIGAHEEEGQILIYVDDTGPGMPQKALEHLFKPFQGSVRSGGTGLGLVVAKELIEAHSGTIAHVAKSSAGTRFEIRLPLMD